MPKIEDRVAALEAKLKQLKDRKQRKEARTRTIEARRTRREELRRKILAGAIVLAKVEQGLFDQKTFKSWLDTELTIASDRALFGLTPKV
jgi:predicted RNase H-like nuclease (RuvC/YqgF family)